MPETTFGAFVAAVPGRWRIGTGVLESGRKVKSFVCEGTGLGDALEITALGGWREYRRLG